MVEFIFESPDQLLALEDMNLKGFSLEGNFMIIGENGKKHNVSERFKIMNRLSDLLAFNIYVKGGSTGGAGRNEHGEAHFELTEKNSMKPLGKIFMPSLNDWTGLDFKSRVKLMVVKSGNDISKSDKKLMVRWLEMENNENLLRCHKEWNDSNKDNNRVKYI